MAKHKVPRTQPTDVANQGRLFLYVWSEKDKPDECKFGERWVKANTCANKSVMQRVKQSLGVRKDLLRTGVVTIDHTWDVTSWAQKVGRAYSHARMDDYVRAFVGHRKFSTGEIHELSSSELILKVNQLMESSTQKLPTARISTYQALMAEQVLEAFDQGHKVVLAELCARFGKTIWSGVVALELQAEIVVVTSYVKTVFASFAKDLTSFSQWQDHVHVNTQTADWQLTVQSALAHGKKVFAYVSMAPGSKRDARIQWLLSRPEHTLLILDEADFGSHTPNQAQALKSCIQPGHEVLIMTGTNADRAVKLWNVDHMVSVTYPELLVQKARTLSELSSGAPRFQPTVTLEHFEIDRERDTLMPLMSLYQLDLSEPVAQSLAQGEWYTEGTTPEERLPSWAKFAAHPQKSKGFFVRILETVFLGKHQVEAANVDLQTLNWFGRDKSKVAMMFLPHQTGIESGALKAVGEIAAQALPAWRIITLGGGDIRIQNQRVKNANAEQTVRDQIAQAQKLNQSVLIISSQMAQRSFSIPEITELYLAYDAGQAGATIQKMSRVLTPGKDPHKVGKIISLSFDPNRDDKFDALLLVTAENIKRQQPQRDSMEIMDEILSTMDIWQGGAHSGVRVNKDEFLSAAMARKSVCRVIGTVADITKLTWEQIVSIAQGTVTASRIDTVSHVPKGKTRINQKKPVKTLIQNWDAKVVQQARERITAVAENTDMLLCLTRCTSVWDAIRAVDANPSIQTEVIHEFGLSWEEIKRLYEAPVITPLLLDMALKKV